MATVYVDVNNNTGIEDGTQVHPYRSIAVGLTNLSPNGDIYVASGTYYESLVITSAANLHGAPINRPQILGDASGYAVIYFKSSGSIEYFSIGLIGSVYEGVERSSGIVVDEPATTMTVRNCAINGTAVAIEIGSSSAPALIENNTLTNNDYGIGIPRNLAKVTCTGNQINNNKTGIASLDTAVDILSNTIIQNRDGIQIATRSETPVTVVAKIQNNNITQNNNFGIWFDQDTAQLATTLDLGGGGYSQGGNTIGNNSIYDVYNQTLDGTVWAIGNSFLTTSFANQTAQCHIITTGSGGGMRFRRDPRLPIDLPPTISISALPVRLWPADRELKTVSISVQAEDDSGVAPIVLLQSIISSDPDSDLEEDDMWGDIEDYEVGVEDVQVSLRAEKDPAKSERLYTLTYTATDNIGQSAQASIVVRVAPE